jgi:hypothetical protein
MRILTALVLAQCLGVGFLVYRAAGVPAATTMVPPASVATAAPAMPGAAPGPGMDELQLRQIIREELAAAGTPGVSTPRAGTPPVSPEEMAQRREDVEQKLAQYRSAGRISDAEMSDLQGRIAKLDPASRREMLGRLTRAINAREIEGQL